MKAEARFLRAYFYFELVKRYGGVPIIGDKAVSYTHLIDSVDHTKSNTLGASSTVYTNDLVKYQSATILTGLQGLSLIHI